MADDQYPRPVWVRHNRWPDGDVQPGLLHAWEKRDGRWWAHVTSPREYVPGIPMPDYDGWVPASRVEPRDAHPAGGHGAATPA